MAKQIQTILLNEIQMATFRALSRQSVTTVGAKRETPGVLAADVVGDYKANVIGALVRAGALTTYHKGYRIAQNVAVQQRPAPTPRTPRNDAGAQDAAAV
jgi:hypothetical protein